MNKEKAIELWDQAEKALHKREAPYKADPRSQWIDPFRIFGNLYYVGDRVVSSHLIDTGDGLILFDTGLPFTSEVLKERIRYLGYRLEDLKYIIHTHEHIDHFGATYELQQEYGCKACIHKDAADVFRIHPHHTEIQSSTGPETSLFVPDVEFVHGDVISLGNLRIECFHTPGHSAGATTFFFDLTEGEKTIRAGLCGVNGTMTLHIGRLAKYGIPFSEREKYVASILSLRGMEIDLTLDTHPRPNGILAMRARQLENPESNPFIDPSAWDRTLNDYLTRYNMFVQDELNRLEEDSQ